MSKPTQPSIQTEPTWPKANLDFVNFLNEIENVQADKTNSHFRSKYASLAEVLSTIKTTARKHRLAYHAITDYNLNVPISGESTPTMILLLRSRFIHENGEIIEAGVLPFVLSKTQEDPQKFGSMMTYLRRQAAQTACGISTDQDDDGNLASQAPASLPSRLIPGPMPRPSANPPK